MKNNSETIKKFVGFLNNKEENGGYWLPNIQRPFVWKEEQIEKLFDSILREYPIGTLLVWKSKSKIKRRKFIDLYHKDIKLSDYYVPEDDSQKMMVLDGQQRLQSLFIGLMGSYDKKELYMDLLSGDLVAPEDIKFQFEFLLPNVKEFPWVRFKDLVMTDKKSSELKKEFRPFYGGFSEAEKDRIEDNIELVSEVFRTQENVIYQLVDSVDRPDVYTEEDVVEIFIRANSGGTPLGKSDLLFSLLTASWDESEEKIDSLLIKLNRTGFKFTRDFVLKCSLILLNLGARYKIEKFREPSTKQGIEDNWQKIESSISFVKDFIYGKTFLRTDKTLPSYTSLFPLIYAHYHYPGTWGKGTDMADFLVRGNLTRIFSGSADSFTDTIIRDIKDNQGFNLQSVLDEVVSSGRSMRLLEKDLLELHYSSKEIHLLFNLWYGMNYQPAWTNNAPEIDHIFPQSALKKIKDKNPRTGKFNIMRYKGFERDQVANLMLLTKSENGAGGKSDTLPEVWFADKSDEYLDKHLIPRDRDLWKIENFDVFVEARKKLILEKFKDLIYRKDESSTNTVLAEGE